MFVWICCFLGGILGAWIGIAVADDFVRFVAGNNSVGNNVFLAFISALAISVGCAGIGGKIGEMIEIRHNQPAPQPAPTNPSAQTGA